MLPLIVAIDPGSSSSDSTSTATPINKTFQSSYPSDGDDSDKILQKYPLPLLGKDPIAEWHELSDLEGGDLIGSPIRATKKNGTSSKSKEKSSSKHQERSKSRPSKRNQAKKCHKDPDDCRLDSDKDQFKQLQMAKDLARKSQRKAKSMSISPANASGSDGETQQEAGEGAIANAANTHKLVVPTSQDSHTLAYMPLDMQKRFKAQLQKVLASDKKLSRDERSEALAKLRKSYLLLKFKNDIMLGCEAKCAELTKINAQLQKKIAAKTSKNKAMVLRESDEEKKRINEGVVNELWRLLKFINCKEDEDQATEYLYKLLYPKDPVDDDKMYSWMATYKKHIKDCLHAKRNYATSQLKSCAFKMLDSKESLPTVEMVRKCINRTIDVDNAEEMAIFKWYWESALPKMVGAIEWGPSVRYYCTISGAKLPNDENRRALITPSHEGMLLAIWDNQFEKWHDLHAFAANPDNKGKKQINRGGKYTSCEKGQRMFGGWEPEGIEAFNTYVQEAAAARKTPNRKELEKKTLQLLRIQYNIDHPDHDSQARANRSRKRKNLPNDAPIASVSSRVVRSRMLEEEAVSDDD